MPSRGILAEILAWSPPAGGAKFRGIGLTLAGKRQTRAAKGMAAKRAIIARVLGVRTSD